jgi:hypothetical protein
MEASDMVTNPAPMLVRIAPNVARDYAERNVFPTLRGSRLLNGAEFYTVPLELAKEVLDDARARHARPFHTTDGKKGHHAKKSYCALIENLDRALNPAKWAKLDAEVKAAAAERQRKWKEEQARKSGEFQSPSPSEVQSLSPRALLDRVLGREVADSPPSNRDDGLWNDPGGAIAEARMTDSPARFRVGQTVRYWSPWHKDREDGQRMEITVAYGLHKVSDDDGPFVEASGDRISWRWGYCAQARGGKSSFFPAYMLQSIDYERHIRLVPPMRQTREERKSG